MAEMPVDELRCPECAAAVGVDGDRQQLLCTGCARTFPILGGIPRFVGQEHLASFGRQWNRYEVAHDDEDRATFEAKTGISLSELSGRRVLDAGCGGGRYSKVAAQAGARSDWRRPQFGRRKSGCAVRGSSRGPRSCKPTSSGCRSCLTRSTLRFQSA